MYLDNSASFHMTRNRHLLSDLEEKDLRKNIEFGDDGRYNSTDIDTVPFKRESSSPLMLKDVMFLVGLKKNLIFIAVFEDHNYNVIFSKGKNFL